VVDIIKQAKKSIIIIDNYIDETVLTMLNNRKDLGKKVFGFSKIETEEIVRDFVE
jgi:hypothetical protein